MDTIASWWHKVVLKHPQRVSHVSVPMFDPFSKGQIIRCRCGKLWML
jgi:hypothetical protein